MDPIIAINDNDTPAQPRAEFDFEALKQKLANLIMPPLVAAEARFVEITQFDPNNNILNPAVYAKMVAAISDESECGDVFTVPQSTTFTTEGFLSNVSIREDVFIHVVGPRLNEDVVGVESNYGKYIHPSYRAPAKKIRKSNRGRKCSKGLRKKARKVQGSGEHCNSQVTFLLRSQEGKQVCLTDLDENKQPVDRMFPQVYKVKVFRNGQIQIPGVKPNNINDVLKCMERLVVLLNEILVPNNTDPSKRVYLIHLNPDMKNYKFHCKLNTGNLIDLPVLYDLFKRIWDQQTRAVTALNNARAAIDAPIEMDGDGNTAQVVPALPTNFDKIDPNAPVVTPTEALERANEDIATSLLVFPFSITDVKYTREDSKVSVCFSAPTLFNPGKTIRINFFMEGKINILGAHDEDITKRLVGVLYDVIKANYSQIVVQPPDSSFAYNITPMSNRELITWDQTYRGYEMPNTAQIHGYNNYIKSVFSEKK
ncbi:TATA box-binding protein [Faustovirus]|nr:TATA box-binding protein [Faustovirus]QJX73583.1 TATA box-binding protein [Faustovirus]